ncbi:MAG: 3-hydroxyacyl-CoA dehydrogenase family protein [Candidatus Micrarchaeota archaeon]|nr:3-hydroxyacyl-CoA dehydrogenase family protein [Candidatus Micrarchaeota archaeon]MDE1834806.1 3-hydroxyacyl-CoA dehydrogenase family protein [Candidatus Micrarchaeota archaeon]MDE1859449.1 3-hydroxyacyl-CoA dehydrogenase family protein [Candidatus Micrarchaeota archaeon]
MKIAIIGAGTMGSGIAQVVITANHDAIMVSESAKSVAAGLERVKAGFEKAISKGKMTQEQRDSYLSHLKTTSSMNDIKEVDIVIEAVPEDLMTKRVVLEKVENAVRDDTIIATNTSSISIDALAKTLQIPERFLGLHFFNPAPVMKVIEVVRGKKTSSVVMEKARKFGEGLGKVAVEVNDFPGFISNRILMVYLNESINALDQGVATKEAIDTIAKLGFNHPMGPLELADFIGLDVCKDIMNAIYLQTNDPKFKPAALLEKLVGEGRLGRKSSKGFYDY